jgi:hypothetical protein
MAREWRRGQEIPDIDGVAERTPALHRGGPNSITATKPPATAVIAGGRATPA